MRFDRRARRQWKLVRRDAKKYKDFAAAIIDPKSIDLDPNDPYAWEKAMCPPKPEWDLIVDLFDEGADDLSTSVFLRDYLDRVDLIDKLARGKAKHIVVSGDKIYLTGMGKLMALAEIHMRQIREGRYPRGV